MKFLLFESLKKTQERKFSSFHEISFELEQQIRIFVESIYPKIDISKESSVARQATVKTFSLANYRYREIGDERLNALVIFPAEMCYHKNVYCFRSVIIRLSLTSRA